MVWLCDEGSLSVVMQAKSSVSRSHAQGLRTLLHYCQCRLHELGGEKRGREDEGGSGEKGRRVGRQGREGG